MDLSANRPDFRYVPEVAKISGQARRNRHVQKQLFWRIHEQCQQAANKPHATCHILQVAV
jgi:hypothetical protein